EAGLAERDDAIRRRHPAQRGERRVVGRGGVVRVDADGGDHAHAGPGAGECERGSIVVDPADGTHTDDSRDARRGRARQDRVAVVVELRLGDVAVRVDQRGLLRHEGAASTRGKSASGGRVRWPSTNVAPQGRSRSSSADAGSPSWATRRGAVSGRTGATSCAVTRSASKSSCRMAPTSGSCAGSFASRNGAASVTYLLA